MSLHRVRFAQPVDADRRRMPGPKAAATWRFGPAVRTGADGLPTRLAEQWGGVGFYADLDAAAAVLDDPAAHLPFLSESAAAWHALLCPISQRGEANWFAPGCHVAPAADPGGTLAVITTAGFDPPPPGAVQAGMARQLRFVADVERVRAWYATLPGTIASEVFEPQPAGADGMTLTIWRNDAAMAAAAYRPGPHRTQLDAHRAAAAVDRTAFIRARILRSVGCGVGCA